MPKTNILYFIMLLFCISCSNSQIPEIKVKIPTDLQNNEGACVFIKKKTDAVNTFNSSLTKLAKLTGGKDLNSADSLTKMQMLILAKEGFKMMRVSSKLEELDLQQDSIKNSLDLNQQKAFNEICAHLQNKLGAIEYSALGLDESDAADFKQKIEAQQAYQAHNDSIQTLRDEAIRNMPPEEQANYKEKPKEEVTKAQRIKFFIAFGVVCLLVLACLIYATKKIIRMIKSIR